MKLVSKMRKKKNNKGFSLVELIVVVLIIAIIAVALAPQVMKWVGKAKDNVDVNNAATLKSAALTAYAEMITDGKTLPTEGATILVTKDAIEGNSTIAILPYLKEILNGEYPKTKVKSDFTIKITHDGKVTVEPTPIPTP